MRLPDQLAVIVEEGGEPSYCCVEHRSFEPVELVVLEVDIVNDFGDFTEPRVILIQ